MGKCLIAFRRIALDVNVNLNYIKLRLPLYALIELFSKTVSDLLGLGPGT